MNKMSPFGNGKSIFGKGENPFKNGKSAYGRSFDNHCKGSVGNRRLQSVVTEWVLGGRKVTE